MEIILVGLNHRTAPVALREAFLLSGCGLPLALADLKSLPEPNIAEAAILSTCNRTEIYAVVRDDGTGFRALDQFLVRLQGLSHDVLDGHLYRMQGQQAVEHLLAVASGIDSMILGEPQILGQVGTAFDEARAAGTAGPILDRLFRQALHTGKRARSETSIGRHTTSVSHAGAARLVQASSLGSLSRVLIVGAGEMAQLASDALGHEGFRDLAFINRTFIAAETLAAQHSGRAFAWRDLDEALTWADAVVTATGAPHLVLGEDDVRRALASRADRELIIIDMAVPRDVAGEVAALPGVRLFDIDSLTSVVTEHQRLREAEVPSVERIVSQEAGLFREWLDGRQVVPVIRDLRRRARELADAELQAALRRLPEGDAQTREAMERLAHRLVGRLLHEPTTRLRTQAAEGDAATYAQTVRELFALDGDAAPASGSRR